MMKASKVSLLKRLNNTRRYPSSGTIDSRSGRADTICKQNRDVSVIVCNEQRMALEQRPNYRGVRARGGWAGPGETAT
jgi:hypothetical protein